MIPAIVLVGGLGTRLNSVSGGTPKPLISVGNRPFLEYVLDTLVDAESPSICLATSYRSQLFRSHFGTVYRGTPLTYSVETEPLGTGGAIHQCLVENDYSRALVLNGDTLFKIALRELVRAHVTADSTVTLALRSIDDVSRYGAVTRRPDNRISSFNEKGQGGPGLINGGTYVIDRSVFSKVTLPQNAFSFETDFLQKHVDTLRPLGVTFEGYFIDIGVPQDLEQARRDLGRGI